MIVLTAHGTRDPEGPKTIDQLARSVRARGVDVAVAYADVRRPDVTAVLDRLASGSDVDERAVVVVPAFLAAGYHVRTDIPAQIASSALPRVAVAETFGPAPELLEALTDRVRQVGCRTGDTVVLAAAGSGDPRALAEVDVAARALEARLSIDVRVGYAATAEPSIGEAVTQARADGRTRAGGPVGGRVIVASWLLAPGLFQRRAEKAGADAVSAPLGDHPAVADLVLRRFAEAARCRVGAA